LILHPVKHLRAVERSLIAQGYIGVLIGDFQQPLANSPTLSFVQLWEFLDDVRCAHGEIIAAVGNLSGEKERAPARLVGRNETAWNRREISGRKSEVKRSAPKVFASEMA